MGSRWAPRPATVLGVVAVVLALSGTAIAAHHYLITSTKQISPSVLKKLQGAKGAKGATGATGATGANGTTGATGSTGAAGHDGGQGPVGPSNVVQSFFDGPNTIPVNSTTFQALVLDLGRNSVPAAKYIATAKLSITPTGPGEVSCTLFSYNGAAGGSDTAFVQGTGVESTMVMTEPGDFTSATGGNWGFVVYCSTPLSGTTASYKMAKITAIQTGNFAIDTG